MFGRYQVGGQAFGRTQCLPSSLCQHPAIPHKSYICLEGFRSPFSRPKAGKPGAKHRRLQRVATDPIRGNAEEDEATVREPASSPSPCSTSDQQDEVRIAVLGLFSLSFLHRQRQQEPRYERTPRRWLGLRPGKLILAEEQELSQHQYALHVAEDWAQRTAPSEVWAALGGFMLATLLHWVVAVLRERRVQRKQRQEAQRRALVQAQKASYRHRSRFQRALGGAAAASDAGIEGNAYEDDGADDYDGAPEDGLPAPADREEDLPTEEEDKEEEYWEYDSEALKQWEQFVKKSKATQVSEDNWWDMDAAAMDDRTLAKSQEQRDWNA